MRLPGAGEISRSILVNQKIFFIGLRSKYLFVILMIANSVLADDETARLVADLSDYPDIPDDPDTSPVERLAAFADLVRATGLASAHFLIDRLDEHVETANDPDIQADILEPLLAHLQVLELPGVAFKFFLWQAARDILLERPAVRRDRLTDRAVTVVWSVDRLKQLLRVRLAVYSALAVRLSCRFQPFRHHDRQRDLFRDDLRGRGARHRVALFADVALCTWARLPCTW